MWPELSSLGLPPGGHSATSQPGRQLQAFPRDGDSRAQSLVNKELWNNDHSRREQIRFLTGHWWMGVESHPSSEQRNLGDHALWYQLNPFHICFFPNQSIVGGLLCSPPDFFFCSCHSALFWGTSFILVSITIYPFIYDKMGFFPPFHSFLGVGPWAKVKVVEGFLWWEGDQH